jgi:hypothetical protein
VIPLVHCGVNDSHGEDEKRNVHKLIGFCMRHTAQGARRKGAHCVSRRDKREKGRRTKGRSLVICLRRHWVTTLRCNLSIEHGAWSMELKTKKPLTAHCLPLTSKRGKSTKLQVSAIGTRPTAQGLRHWALGTIHPSIPFLSSARVVC